MMASGGTSFTMNAATTIYGAFLCGGGTAANTKGNTAGGGTIYAAGKYTTAKPVVSTDVLTVVCSITLADV
jgi:hypothetical protein